MELSVNLLFKHLEERNDGNGSLRLLFFTSTMNADTKNIGYPMKSFLNGHSHTSNVVTHNSRE